MLCIMFQLCNISVASSVRALSVKVLLKEEPNKVLLLFDIHGIQSHLLQACAMLLS